MASRASEAYGLLEESLKRHGLFCIRFPRSSVAPSQQMETMPFGKWKKELDGNGTAIVSVGPVTVELKELLEKSNKKVVLFNAIYLKPMDEDAVDELAKHNKVIIYDAYGIGNGFAHELTTLLVTKKNYKGQIVIKSIPDVFVEHASQKEQLKKFGLLPEQIIELL